MRIGYARISEEDQSLPFQRHALQAAGCAQVYEERARGQTTRRPQRDACLQALRAGDTLVVWRLDRLGRSLSDLIRLSAELQARGIHLESLSEQLHTGSPAGQGLWRAFGLLADFERHLSRERAAVGLKALRARGQPGGRPRKLQPHELQAARALRAAGQMPVKAIAACLGVAPSTVYRNLAEPARPDGPCETPPALYA
jgi:DNA invertase Pin-like site-specific DNA recombinase